MKKPKVTVGIRAKERTKFILSELADIHKMTLSELINEILDKYVMNQKSNGYEGFLRLLNQKYDEIENKKIEEETKILMALLKKETENE